MRFPAFKTVYVLFFAAFSINNVIIFILDLSSKEQEYRIPCNIDPLYYVLYMALIFAVLCFART